MKPVKWSWIMLLGSSIALLATTLPQNHNEKYFEISGKQVKVTHEANNIFYGRYQGNKTGYLLLNPDGTGEYRYDIHVGSLGDCEEGIIQLEWGLILDEKNEVVHFKRDYGYSYPIIYHASGPRTFQGCQKDFLVDYILDKNNGKLIVSSSDDWEKDK